MKPICHRCGGEISDGMTRKEKDGHIFHFYCWWKLQQKVEEPPAVVATSREMINGKEWL